MTPSDRALLAAVLDEVRALRADLARRRGPRDQADVDFVREVGLVTEGRAFTARDLVEHAARVPVLGRSMAETTCDSPRQVGKLLRRLAGRDVSGWRVEAVGATRDGALWRVRECESDRATLARP